MTTTKARRRKLAELNLNRDLYAECCVDAGFDPMAREVIDWDLQVEVEGPLKVESARALAALPAAGGI